MELRPDAVLAGKLRLLRPLGQGGMGVVWAAQHLTLQTEVAVKFIRPERAASSATLTTRFEREARATARIAHPHVVQIMDYGAVDDAVPFIVMELLRGASLAELLERGGRLSFGTVKSLVRQLGSALGSAHCHGIVHRDVKPQNIFITKGSRDYPLFVKVLDFGVAKMLGDSQVPEAGPTLTETGMVIGSPPYMSPEQLEGSRDVDLRSDLWSLGVIVYEVLTGRQPFQGGSFVSVGAAVLKGKYRPASELRPNLPAGVDDWIAKALCLDPAGRFQSAGEMIAAFEALDSPAGEPAAPMLERVGEEHREDEGPAKHEEDPALRTTVEAVAERDPSAPPMLGLTAGHLPVAVKPAPLEARGKLRRRIAFGVAVVSAAGLAGVALSAAPRRTGPSSCPPEMALIEGTTFAMGSAYGGETPSDETPPHDVIVKSFCLDRTEVTVAAYAACAGCDRPLRTVEFEGLTPNGRTFESQFCTDEPSHPQNCVDWHQAKAFCAAQGKRLPVEAEWELAARGKEGRTYPWGNAPPSADRLNACGAECSKMLSERREKVGKGPWPAMHDGDDRAEATAPVGRYPAGATAAGVMDLAGNVWEWTETPYCPYGKDDCGDSRRVLRGGAWDTTESQDVRGARRYPSAPTARGRSIGFRCAKGF